MAITNLTQVEKESLANRYDENKRTFERALARDLRAFFASMSAELFASLAENGLPVDFNTYMEELTALLEKNYRKTGAFFSAHMQRLLKETQPRNFEHEESILELQEERSLMDAALLLLLIPVYRNHARQHAGFILDTTRKVFRDAQMQVFTDSFLQQRQLTQLESARQITKIFNERNKNRVIPLSENEVGDIAQISKQAEAEAFARRLRNAGLIIEPQKTWITVGDEKVRDAHRGANGQKRPLDGLYTVGGELLAYPKDTTHGASLWNTINCRCDSVTEV
jgi:hypothetical protein